MKKFLIIVSMMFCLLPVTSQEIPSKVKNQLEKSGLYCFGEDADGNQSKPVIKFLVQSKEDFTKKTLAAGVKKDLFKNSKKISYEDIIKTYKDGEYLFEIPSWNYMNYSWKDGKKVDYSVVYSLSTYYPISGPGSYVIRIFEKDYVYTITLTNQLSLDERNDEYEKLNDTFVFREGQKMDKSRGLEQTQGYYCISEDTAADFYERLQKKDTSLPNSIVDFQKAEEFLEGVLKKYWK